MTFIDTLIQRNIKKEEWRYGLEKIGKINLKLEIKIADKVIVINTIGEKVLFETLYYWMIDNKIEFTIKEKDTNKNERRENKDKI